MTTLGIDLAAEPKFTAGCVVEWSGGAAAVHWVAGRLGDDELLERAREATVVGIDAPFGWPTLFVEAVSAHHAGRRWPIDAWDRESRRNLRLRVTDRHVHAETGITPLSVSSDTIAIPATRCARLIDALGVTDRSGDGRVYEAYPAAALRRWSLPYRSYKGAAHEEALTALFGALRSRVPWLTIPPDAERVIASSDHAFDALVAALVARAAQLGLTARPPPADAAAARVEGWIALPAAGSLERLGGGGRSAR
jgi:predicted nuclease with RNAse H fold